MYAWRPWIFYHIVEWLQCSKFRMDFKIKSSLSQPHKNLHPMNMGGAFIAACKKSSADQNITTVGRPKARAKKSKDHPRKRMSRSRQSTNWHRLFNSSRAQFRCLHIFACCIRKQQWGKAFSCLIKPLKMPLKKSQLLPGRCRTVQGLRETVSWLPKRPPRFTKTWEESGFFHSLLFELRR